MHLKGLIEMADGTDDDTEEDPALQEDDNEKPFPGEVEALDRTSGHIRVVAPDFDLQLRQGSRSGMVCGEIPQHALFEVA
jgi:hypothetical protein